MDFLDKISRFLNKILVWMAVVFLVAMMFLTCSNIFLRMLWLPVKGTFELMGYFGAIVTAFALGYTQIKRGHIAVTILVDSFSKRARKILTGTNNLTCMLFFALAAWQSGKYATSLLKAGEVTETLRIIYYPFTYGVALGFALLSLAFLVEILQSLFPEKEGEQ